eukprot:g5681.t1
MKLVQVIVVVLVQLQVFISANLLHEYVRQSSRPQRHGPSIWDSSSKTKGFQWVDKSPYKYGIESFADGLCGEKLPFDAVKESDTKPSVVKEMEKLNYAVNKKPGDVNVIGVRQTNPLGVCKNGKSSKCWKKVFTNKFQDELHIVWKCSNNKWRHYQTEFTTLPGWDLDRKKGALSSVMAPGQYKNTYCIGDHRGTPAMTQSATVKQWILQRHGVKGSSTCLYKLQRETPSTKRHSLNFHGTINGRGRPKQNKGKFPSTNAVNSWSHGCQVTFGKKFRDEVLALIGTSMNDDALAEEHKVNPDTSTCLASRSDYRKKSSLKALQKSKKEFPSPCKIEKKDKSYSFKTEVRHYILIKNDPTVKCFATNGNGKSALLRSN